MKLYAYAVVLIICFGGIDLLEAKKQKPLTKEEKHQLQKNFNYLGPVIFRLSPDEARELLRGSSETKVREPKRSHECRPIEKTLAKVKFEEKFGPLSLSDLYQRYALKKPEIQQKVNEIFQQYKQEALVMGTLPKKLFSTINTDALQKAGFVVIKKKILFHPDLPDYIIKLDRIPERLYGHYVLSKVLEKNPHLPIVIPHKYYAVVALDNNIKLPIVLSEKIDFKSDEERDQWLQFPPAITGLTEFLRAAGYCDSHRGNIKLTADDKIGIIDTDLYYYRQAGIICGSPTEELFEMRYKSSRSGLQSSSSSDSICLPGPGEKTKKPKHHG